VTDPSVARSVVSLPYPLAPNRSRPPRMICSRDGLGLGHMHRTTSIAAELLETRLDSALLTPFLHTDPNASRLPSPA
jgi:hypothetical protein